MPRTCPRGSFRPPGSWRIWRCPEAFEPTAACAAGDVISPHYDPMIAKVIVQPDTEIALKRLAPGCGTEVAGTVTNPCIPRALAAHRGSARAVDTGSSGGSGALGAAPGAPRWSPGGVAVGAGRAGGPAHGFASGAAGAGAAAARRGGSPCVLRARADRIGIEVAGRGSGRALAGAGLDGRRPRHFRRAGHGVRPTSCASTSSSAGRDALGRGTGLSRRRCRAVVRSLRRGRRSAGDRLAFWSDEDGARGGAARVAELLVAAGDQVEPGRRWSVRRRGRGMIRLCTCRRVPCRCCGCSRAGVRSRSSDPFDKPARPIT